MGGPWIRPCKIRKMIIKTLIYLSPFLLECLPLWLPPPGDPWALTACPWHHRHHTEHPTVPCHQAAEGQFPRGGLLPATGVLPLPVPALGVLSEGPLFVNDKRTLVDHHSGLAASEQERCYDEELEAGHRKYGFQALEICETATFTLHGLQESIQRAWKYTHRGDRSWYDVHSTGLQWLLTG